MQVTQLEKLGEWDTLREAARTKGTTSNAFYLWLRDQDKLVTKLGSVIVVRQADIVEYLPRGK